MALMPDLFDPAPDKKGRKDKKADYSARDIEVLEGLEPVRRRPGMFIGGIDEPALHRLVAEVLDNAMDEVVAGHASRIDIALAADGTVTVADNGRGIPVDPHPKFKDKSALEVILTMLHSGAKFSDKVYRTAGGLHGVGLSVVNALSDRLVVEVARGRKLWTQRYSRGKPSCALKMQGAVHNRRGTTIIFHPDPKIFGEAMQFRPERIYRMARSKAYLFRGVEIRWSCEASLLDGAVPERDRLHFPGGLSDYLATSLDGRATITPRPFAGLAKFTGGAGYVEWAVCWPEAEDGFFDSYCNTVPTPQGGSHESGLRAALTRGMKAYGEFVGNRRAAQIVAEDVVDGAYIMLSLFIQDPHFQGQTKERLGMPEASRLIEAPVKDHFDHWLSDDPQAAQALLTRVIARSEERRRRRQERALMRKSATRKLRLPGKLTDCTRSTAEGTELFLVEGDSAGGTAKQARQREVQAVLPLRGKILNVVSATPERLYANQELSDLIQALGCGTRAQYQEDKLRYERVIIMTDADVDGAHIASLLLTFFYKEMPKLIENGHLYLALPPLYRLTQGAEIVYARDEAHKDELIKARGQGKVEVSRFKGLGEMPAAQLRETTMDPERRSLLRVVIPDPANKGEAKAARETAQLVESLMGRRPELRLAFIQEKAKFVRDLDV
ncbi:MAG: DNA topoisomerase IV subunit B [Proteobacteria bacterium]|nr:DNA topoisomerase IV subunit B [Pseudomonadota bacterium]